MGAITFYTAYQQPHVRAQLDGMLATFREMFDVFVSNRLRRTAAEAEYARSQRIPDTRSKSSNPQ
jgi:hypothetical protein